MTPRAASLAYLGAEGLLGSRVLPEQVEENQEAPRTAPSVVFEPPALADSAVGLSSAEVDFFVEHGFLVKKRLLSANAVDAAMERIWAHLLDRAPIALEPDWRLRRDDPATWLNPRWAPMPPTPKAGPHEGRQRIAIHGATIKLHDLGAADYIVDLVPNNPRVRRLAEALLGDLRPSFRTRGVYAVFPQRESAPDGLSEEERVVRALGPHTDRVCQQLNVCAYLGDVPPRGGGFTLYPGSHRILFRAHQFAANWSPRADFRSAMHRVLRDIQPLEVPGEKGDVIFWHGRTVHSAGAHFGRNIRWAVFADFTQHRPTLDDDAHRAAGLYEWFKDAELFRDDDAVDEDSDMWKSWRALDARLPT